MQWSNYMSELKNYIFEVHCVDTKRVAGSMEIQIYQLAQPHPLPHATVSKSTTERLQRKAQTALLKYVTSRPSNPLQSPTMLKTTCPSTLNYGSMKRRLLVCSTFTTLKSIVTVDYTALTFVQPDSPRSERLRSKAKFLRSSDLHGDLFVGCKAVNVLCYAAAKALPKAKPCAVLQTPQG